ncbi:MAG: FtsW/RodA/SpoVE family cell cycle protein [Anaerolineae bacterium]
MTKRQTRLKSPDYPFMIIVAALTFIGVIMVYSATYVWSYEDHGHPYYFFLRQLLWLALGSIVMLVMMNIEYHRWQRLSLPIMGGAVLALIALLLVGPETNGARRGFFSGSVQPSELAKLAMVIYVANWLSSKGGRIRQVSYGLIPFGILVGLVAGLIMLQPDLSTSFLVMTTALAMFFIAGGDLVQLVTSGAFGGFIVGLMIIGSEWRLDRLEGWLDPCSDSTDTNYQICRILTALREGGPFGQGLASIHKTVGYIPASHTDSIFAIVGNDFGLMGCLALIGLFACLAYRGVKVALQAPDTFGAVLATGVTCWISFQALVNVASATSSIPYTGIPLPFISFGGSSLLSTMAGVGLLLNVSRGTKKKEGPQHASLDLGWRNGRSRLSGPRHRRGLRGQPGQVRA